MLDGLAVELTRLPSQSGIGVLINVLIRSHARPDHTVTACTSFQPQSKHSITHVVYDIIHFSRLRFYQLRVCVAVAFFDDFVEFLHVKKYLNRLPQKLQYGRSILDVDPLHKMRSRSQTDQEATQCVACMVA